MTKTRAINVQNGHNYGKEERNSQSSKIVSHQALSWYSPIGGSEQSSGTCTPLRSSSFSFFEEVLPRASLTLMLVSIAIILAPIDLNRHYLANQKDESCWQESSELGEAKHSVMVVRTDSHKADHEAEDDDAKDAKAENATEGKTEEKDEMKCRCKV